MKTFAARELLNLSQKRIRSTPTRDKVETRDFGINYYQNFEILCY